MKGNQIIVFAVLCSLALILLQGSLLGRISKTILESKIGFSPRTIKNCTGQNEDFTITVLTMNREKSLLRLLRSLEATNYGGDCIDLVIKIDHPSPSQRTNGNNEGVIEVANSFHFTHGSKTVIVQEENLGLAKSWFKAWIPKHDKDHGIIIEDDIEMASPVWYLWLKQAWSIYGEAEAHDMAGISLCRQTLIIQKPERREEIVNDNQPFLYRLVGSHGFSPHPKHWRMFLNWIDTIDFKTFNVSTPGLISSDWWNKLDRRHIWTQHFIYFSNEKGLFTLHVNLSNNKTLASHWREKGEHFSSYEGKEFPLAIEINTNFPEYDQLRRYDWDAKQIPMALNMKNPSTKKTKGAIRIPYTVIIGGIGKNIDPIQIKSIVPKMKRLGEAFKEYHVLIYENNSERRSRNAWQESMGALGDSATLISKNILWESSHRTERLANARNAFLNYIHTDNHLSSFDYVIITDLDRVCGGENNSISYNISVIAESFSRRSEWDAISFRTRPYWDRWAFREPSVMPYNMWFGSQKSMNAIQTIEQMESYIEGLDPNAMHEVQSAFMMLAMYRLNATKECVYSSKDIYGNYDCEHVSFHKEMIEKNRAKIRLLPQYLCEYPSVDLPSEHFSEEEILKYSTLFSF